MVRPERVGAAVLRGSLYGVEYDRRCCDAECRSELRLHENRFVFVVGGKARYLSHSLEHAPRDALLPGPHRRRDEHHPRGEQEVDPDDDDHRCGEAEGPVWGGGGDEGEEEGCEGGCEGSRGCSSV